MHAYLIVGRQEEKKTAEIDKIAKKFKTQVLTFPLEKIADTRSLNSFIKLKVNKPTAIVIKGVENATREALSAFLKNLEEPQENILYILTASSTSKLLPTIVSRCQTIKTSGEKVVRKAEVSEIKQFLKRPLSGQLAYIERLRSRDDAVTFIGNLIQVCHSSLLKTENRHSEISKTIRLASKTLSNLNAYGNVQLQLTNFVLSLV
jgi:DNA polymerase-3 subunit delta'